ncbi:hypothetical protein DMH04_26685 [Kibdelosporangium aridum]|uniref:Uncharacterized protein n=1 Tax=Kibdelosporangium aridum TaxID=2030 RepID=A0A428Z532_KIBAR|nr:hypothetical protein DMH04_26685 [Kibdelosporangium aridum]
MLAAASTTAGAVVLTVATVSLWPESRGEGAEAVSLPAKQGTALHLLRTMDAEQLDLRRVEVLDDTYDDSLTARFCGRHLSTYRLDNRFGAP